MVIVNNTCTESKIHFSDIYNL